MGVWVYFGKLIEFWYHSVYDLEIVEIEARSSFKNCKNVKNIYDG